MAIFLGLIGLGLFMNLSFYKTYSFQSEENLVISMLLRARSGAINNINQAKHGIYMNSPGNYVLFQGDSYATRDISYDVIMPANSAMSHSGASEIVFSQLTGETTSASIVLTDSTHSATISINSEGGITW